MKKKYIITEEKIDFWGDKKYVIEEKTNPNPWDIGFVTLIILFIFGLLLFYKFIFFKISTRKINKRLIPEEIKIKNDRYSFFCFITHLTCFLSVLIVGNGMSEERFIKLVVIYFLSILIPSIWGMIIGIKRKGSFDLYS